MNVLIGTTNPAKVRRFANMLEGCDVHICTPLDFGLTESPEEVGKDPAENARIKAAFYGQYCDYAISNDSGLYFLDLPYDDPRQPGLHVRTPQGIRLNDDEMIDHYSGLARELGGRISASYLDAIAVYAKGEVQIYKNSKETLESNSFYMLSTPSSLRTPGWPLDSLSVRRDTGIYFVEERISDPVVKKQQTFDEIRNFLLTALKLL